MVILGVVFVATLRVMASFPMGDDTMNPPPADITVWGRQWWWEVEYRRSARVGPLVDGE
ncbi:MAG: hypothetical protein QM736_01465 [Vicinamibacterales bacterium]